MYRRYSQARDGLPTTGQIRVNRFRNALIILLAAALLVLGFMAIPAMRDRGSQRDLYLQRMRAECDEAIRQTSTLSRNAGADSAAILARVRCNIYAIRTLNTLGNSQGGARMLEDDQVLTLQNTVDRYLSFLTTGMDTGEYQTNLQNALTELQSQLRVVK